MPLVQSYVPGFKYDIFLSYSHTSKEWVTQFKTDLEKKLMEYLAPGVSIWIDEKDLRTSADYVKEIRKELEQSAVLLTINTPNYLQSEFCVTECNYFEESWTAGGRSVPRPIMEIYLRTDLALRLFKIQPKHNGTFFYDKDATHPWDAEPFVGPKYDVALRRFSVEISTVLSDLSGKKPTIFIGPPRDAVEGTAIGDLYNGLKKELRQNYRVVAQPIFRSEDLLTAQVSVHFLSSADDSITRQRIDVAIESGKPCVVFAMEAAGPIAELIEVLEERMRTDDKPSIVVRSLKSDYFLISELVTVIEGLIVKPGGTSDGGKRVVYLICHPKHALDEEVSKVAGRLTGPTHDLRISKPDIKYHLDNLSECDGVFLVWGGVDADGDWFDRKHRQINEGAAFRGGRDFLSKAVCLLPPPEVVNPTKATKISKDELVVDLNEDPTVTENKLREFIDRLL